MSKVYGSEKIRRTCVIKGRESEGRVGLLRKNVNVSKIVLENGAEEEIDTALVTDERIQPRPPRQSTRTPVGTEKTYPADKLPRRLCLVKDRGETRYHLLRKSADGSKILEVGVAGTGEWIPTSSIVEEFLVPIPTRARHIERKPVKITKLQGTGDQEYLLLRTTNKGARIVPVYEGNYGQTVDPALLVETRTINQAKKKKGEGVSATEENAGEGTMSEGAVEEAPAAAAPAAAAPAAVAPAAAAPAAVAPVAAAPAQVAPQVARPAQVAPQARPAPGQAVPGQVRPAPAGVAPRPAQPGRPQPVQAPVQR